jgi:signal peptide peptidase SppA
VTAESPGMPESLWALEPRALERLRLAASQPIGALMNGRSALTTDAPLYTNENGVGVIKFEGMVCKRPSFWGWLFGGTASTRVAQEALAAALADPGVKSILFVVDSPGGTVAGTEEMAEAVYRARSVKPVTAYASDMCASAAYWIASQASKLYANATAAVGSIGVYAVAVDLSRMYRNEGIEVDVVKSAPGKGSGVRGTQFTADQRAELQREIDSLGNEFVEAVRRARPSAVAVADGRCFTAREGLSLGLVDGVTTLAELMGQLVADANRWPPVTVTVDVEAPECEPEQPEAAVSTSSDGIVTPGAEQKEAPMSDTTPTETALAALTETVGALAHEVKALKAEKDLDALIAQAKTDRKIQNADTEAAVRAAGEKSLDAARALVGALKVAGPEGGSVVDASGKAAEVVDFNDRAELNRKAKAYAAEKNVSYREAVVAVTRR